jgi:hypothetical protein
MPRALTPSDIEAIRWHAGRGVKPGTIAQWYGVGALEVRAILNKTAPSGAPAGGESAPVSAGTATASRGETGHRLKGSDEVPPSREVEGLGPAPLPSMKPGGQSDRPNHSLLPVTLPQRAVRPPVTPLRSARHGSALELAEIAAEAVRAGRAVTRCPAAVVAETQGVTIDPADAAAMRSRHNAMRDTEHSWRGRKVAPSNTSPNP